MGKKKPAATEHRRQPLLDNIFLQPWFVDYGTACAIRRLLPEGQFRKLRFYFDDWGCLVCRKKNAVYGCNGMCSRCAQRIQKRVLTSLQKRGLPTTTPRPAQHDGYDRVHGAKTLLKDLALGGWSPRRMKLRKIDWD